METHDHHIDVQVLLVGKELMQTANLGSLRKSNKTMDGDWTFFEESGHLSNLLIEEGHFVVFFPSEPHKPGCKSPTSDCPVVKLVFKINTL